MQAADTAGEKTSGPGREDPDRLIWRRRPVTGVFEVN
jgi:hypothetical protein